MAAPCSDIWQNQLQLLVEDMLRASQLNAAALTPNHVDVATLMDWKREML